MIGLGIASVAIAAAGAYTQYDSSRKQASAMRGQAETNRMGAQLQAEQARTSLASLAVTRETSKVQALEQENERQRRAGIADSAGRAAAAFAGFDLESSGSLRALAAENERMVRADVGAIRLLGRARETQIVGEGRNAAARGWQSEAQARLSDQEANTWAATGRNAWVAPTGRLLQSGISTYQATQ